ncbi:MAG: transcription-repair coupling factor [Candidatus Schekmanbacteria bacterium GWA2_38_9]|nr:MAG: transcription-repair coupling factor [Candidatus Schekmanbacteria bacterium GWA2_38_9]
MPVEEKTKPPLSDLINAIESGASVADAKGLQVSSKAFLTILIHRLLQKKILILLPSSKIAEPFYNDLIFFSNNLKPFNDKTASDEIFYFPHWETVPYEKSSPYAEISSKRLLVLDSLLNNRAGIVLITPESLLQKFMSKNELKEKFLNIEAGMEIQKEKLLENLLLCGYQDKDIVEEKGDFSSRGCIVDVFTSLIKNPLRIEFFGDEIVSIREFDLYSQKSTNRLKQVKILPAREVFYNPYSSETIVEEFKKYFFDLKDKGESYERILNYLDGKMYFPGIENFNPLFFKNLESFFEYISDDTLIISEEPAQVKEKTDEFYKEICAQWEILKKEGYPSFHPTGLYISPDDIEKSLKKYQQVFFDFLSDTENSKEKSFFSFDIKTISFLGFEGGVDRLKSCLHQIKKFSENNCKVYFVCSNEGYGKRLQKIFREYDAEVVFNPENRIKVDFSEIADFSVPEILTGKISGGFEFESAGLVIISEEEIFGKKITRRFRRSFDSSIFISDFGDISSGDLLVHIDYGVGKFQGIKKFRIDGIEKDFLAIEYLNSEFLYVPVENLNLVQKYIGVQGFVPKLDHLAGKGWERIKEKAKESIRRMAKKLLGIYAKRKVADGYAFSKDDNWMSEFESTFEYEETPHQLRAIEDVKKDMESSKPMDRLICGDVGYGKTEVALRASFKAANESKQVAVLVPTTILAQQHYQTFANRFSPFPIRVEVLSRFCSARKEKEIIEDLKNGKVDIVIGTHRLLSDDIEFKDIGLVIIDEEQRFGVKHKEKLKKFRNEVDVLTLTATPIPRTLQLSLMGIRDMSIIDTPPEDRQPIKTIVTSFNKELIVQAIKREMERGGQIYFVHNRVYSIHGIERLLKNLVTEARIGVAHGQMKKSFLEDVMIRFIKKEYDILLCTSIIESGLDIPAVNTIIINRADRFGLSDLYQLRGRVGRDGHVAYAYLLIPPKAVLTDDSKKRLRVIEELSGLGSGFKIAAHDLEIRGAGNILGEEQSGQILAIGFDLYCKMIEETINEMQDLSTEDKRTRCVINSKIEAYIPENFVEDSRQRITIYKKLSEIGHIVNLEEFKEEIRDRFGDLPEALNALFKISSLKILGNEAMVSKIDVSSKEIRITFSISFKMSPDILIKIISERENHIKFLSENSLVIRNLKDINQLIDFTIKFMEEIIKRRKPEV